MKKVQNSGNFSTTIGSCELEELKGRDSGGLTHPAISGVPMFV